MVLFFMKKRLFIAIDLPIKVKRKTSRLIKKLSVAHPDIKWEVKDKLHLTLKFLGTTEVLPEKIMITLHKKLVDQKPFTMEFLELGTFVGKSTAVFLEIRKNEELLRTYFKVENAMRDLKFAKERHKFYPHLTLGRSKLPISDMVPLKHNLPAVTVSSVVLYQSQLTKTGSIYTNLGQVDFNLG